MKMIVVVAGTSQNASTYSRAKGSRSSDMVRCYAGISVAAEARKRVAACSVRCRVARFTVVARAQLWSVGAAVASWDRHGILSRAAASG